MKIILMPVIGALNRFSYKGKLLLMFLCVMGPLGILCTLIIRDVNNDIDMLSNESAGVSYIAAARLPLDQIQQHRGVMATLLSGTDSGSRSRAAELGSSVDNSLTTLQNLDRQLSGSTGTSSRTLAIVQRWQQIQAVASSASADQSFEMHSELIDQILQLIAYAADQFEITLSPHLDTYYLGDAIAQRLPTLIEAMGQARALASGAATQAFVSDSTRIELEILLSQVESFRTALMRGLDSAFAANPDIRASLAQSLARSEESAAALTQLLRTQILDTPQITATGQQIFDAASESISANYALFDEIVPQMHMLLAQRHAEARSLRTLDILIVTSILLALAYLFAGLYFSIKDSVEDISTVASAVSAGDLRARVPITTSDEMGKIADSINSITVQYETLISKFRAATEQLAAAAEELSSVSRHSADNIQHQRSETDMIAVSINEMSATVLEVSRSTNNASSAAMDTDQLATAGASIIQKAAEGIVELSREMHESAEGMQRVSADSKAISSVLDVIMGVAEQTNLLALNAAIEAARAGEYGRGFAVVADEVRTLANRTKDSATEIDAMIRTLQSGVTEAVRMMDKSRERADGAVSQVTQATEALNRIIAATGTIKDMNIQIAASSEQQSATTEELNRNVTRIRDIAEQSAAGAAQTTVASDELAKLASDLQNSISWFTVSR